MKKNVIKILCLVFLALLCSFSYYGEVMFHGWEGLKWTGNFYWTLLAAPFIFFLWIKLFVKKDINAKDMLRFLGSYFLTFILLYIFLILIYDPRLTAISICLIFRELESEVILQILVYSTIIISVGLLFFITFKENLQLQKIFVFELTKKEKIILFFLPVYVFCAAEIWMLLLYFLNAFPRMNRYNLSESIFIFKTGTIIFSSFLFEGLYILYKKRNDD